MPPTQKTFETIDTAPDAIVDSVADSLKRHVIDGLATDTRTKLTGLTFDANKLTGTVPEKKAAIKAFSQKVRANLDQFSADARKEIAEKLNSLNRMHGPAGAEVDFGRDVEDLRRKLTPEKKDDGKEEAPKKDDEKKKPDEKKAGGWPKTKKTVDAIAGTAAASIPVVFEGVRNAILNIPLLGEALKGAATLGEPLAKGLQLPLVQSKLIAGAELVKSIPWIGPTLAPYATAVAPYILPTALTGGGLYALGKISDKLHNWAKKDGEEKIKSAGIFKTMWRGLITPVTLPWLALTKAPTLLKKGVDTVKKVSAPLFRHKIGTYGGAFLGYSVLAGMTGGMAIPWAIAGGLGGRFIQKRWFSGNAAAPKAEALTDK